MKRAAVPVEVRSNTPKRNMAVRIRPTDWSMRACETWPSATAASIWLPADGLIWSVPASIAGTTECTAPRSERMNPWNPHWSLSTSVSSSGFWQEKTPLMTAYEHITDATWPSCTAAWNAGR